MPPAPRPFFLCTNLILAFKITVFFRPRTTTEYGSSAFLDCVGREERLPLWLGGGGIGPKVKNAVISELVVHLGGRKSKFYVALQRLPSTSPATSSSTPCRANGANSTRIAGASVIPNLIRG